MKETSTNGHSAQTSGNDSLAGSSSKNDLSEDDHDSNGQQDRNGTHIVDIKQNGFTNEMESQNGGEANGMEQDKGRYR